MFTRRRRDVAVPEVGDEAPEFNLPSAQGGQLRLSMRTVRGPVVVAFYRPGNEEDVAYFKELAGKEEEINLASGSVVGIGVAEPPAARDFARETGMKSFLLYDYAKVTSAQWGLLERDRKKGDASRPGVFVVGPDHKVAHAWTGGRPTPDELLEKVSAITGLPKSDEEKKAEPSDPAADAGKPQKMSAEEREKIKAKRRAAREAGQSVKAPDAGPETAQAAPQGDPPKKMSKEERERIKAERRAAREAGQSPKSAATPPADAPTDAPTDAPKKMSKEERERVKAERRAAREAGQSVKTGGSGTAVPEEAGGSGDAPEPPKKMSKEERERIKAERRAAREAGRSLKQPAGDEPPGPDVGEGERKG